MNLPEFRRAFASRGSNLMWLLGAGASAASGVPTACDLIWDFKRLLYCSQQGIPLRRFPDLGDPRTRQKLQEHFNAKGGYPAEGTDVEYAAYFEAAFQAEADRRRTIEKTVEKAIPSYGHRVLAALTALNHARMIWTTNFDRLVEDAVYAECQSSGTLTVSTIDTPSLAMEAMNENRFPLLVKLHGDFQSRQLKNTTDELRSQDEKLRLALVEACKRFGLCAIGYSGRDRSVMDSLESAAKSKQAFPFGLFWFHRPDSPCLPSVERLINTCRANGVDAHIIETETFDELMGDLLGMLADVPADVLKRLDEQAPRISNAPIPARKGTWPVVRFNALALSATPITCRLVECEIGNTTAVLDAVSKAGVNLVVGRKKAGVIAFGRDEDVKKAFGDYKITKLDLYTIETKRLRYESTELGMLYESLCRGLARLRPLVAHRMKHNWLLVTAPDKGDKTLLSGIAQVTGTLAGTVPNTQLRWAEAVWVTLDYRFDTLWLLVEPSIWLQDTEDRAMAEVGKEFRRARLASRYNRQWNQMIDAWTHLLTGGTPKGSVSTFGISDGIDAKFEIDATTAYCWRRA